MTNQEKVLKESSDFLTQLDRQTHNSVVKSVWYRAYQAVWDIYPTRKKTMRFSHLVWAIEKKDLPELKRLITKYRMKRHRERLITIYNEIWS